MKIKLFLLALFMTVNIQSQNKLTIVISGVEKKTGNLMIALYGSENFLKKPLKGKSVKVESESETVTAVFEGLDPGEYAIALFHDENENRKMDKSALGIPREKYGFSNNVKVTIKPPAYKHCKFAFNGEDIVLHIRVT